MTKTREHIEEKATVTQKPIVTQKPAKPQTAKPKITAEEAKNLEHLIRSERNMRHRGGREQELPSSA